MPEHQEHLKTLLSSADGRPPRRNVFTAPLPHPPTLLVGRTCSSRFGTLEEGETGLNIPCYRLHLSAWCCLPELDLGQVQGGGKTVELCLPCYF